MKIDKRKNYYLTIDTETANTIENPIMFDIGGVVHDKQGNVYETFSFVIDEVFYGEPELMAGCFYVDKLPMYFEDIENGSRVVKNLLQAKRYIQNLCEKYNVTAIIAHNAKFDYRSTHGTLRYETKSKYRYFLPYGIPVWCTQRMSHCTVCQTQRYRKWCEENNYITKNNRPRETAEILYRYITKENDFIESHTALEDALIEKDIFAYVIKRRPKNKTAFVEEI